jgi:uncharacterized protein YabN with tetrapyrrole methylase and pyrophosphatase domain
MDFESAAQATEQVHRELDELAKAKSKEEKEAELGDVLFAVVSVARLEGIDPEEAMRLALDRFSTRFAVVEKQAGAALKTMSAAEKDALWAEAKSSTLINQ